MRTSVQFDIKNYSLTVGTTQIIFINISDFSFVILSPNCADTSRQKCIEYFCKEYVECQYRDILVQKIVHEKLV